MSLVDKIITSLTGRFTPSRYALKPGQLVLFEGPMGARKTTSTIIDAVAANHGDPQKVVGFVPSGSRENDHSKGKMRARTGVEIQGYRFAPGDFSSLVDAANSGQYEVLILDEPHMAGDPQKLYDAIRTVLSYGVDVYVAAVSFDWRGLNFPATQILKSQADRVVPLLTTCQAPTVDLTALLHPRREGIVQPCGRVAHYTMLVNGGEVPSIDGAAQVFAGDLGPDNFVPVCSNHRVFPRGLGQYCQDEGIILPAGYQPGLESAYLPGSRRARLAGIVDKILS